MATDPYSIFVCYRHQHKSFALDVLNVLSAVQGCRVFSDADFKGTTDSHRLQSATHIREDDCVVVVVPPDFDGWLPQAGSELLDKFGARGTPVLADEIKWVNERLADSSKNLVIVVLQQANKDGNWRPLPEDLPRPLKNLPIVITSGSPDWQTTLANEIAEAVRRRGGVGPSLHVHENVRVAVEHVAKEAFHGRVGCQLPLEGSSGPHGFAYQPGLYVDLKGKKPGLEADRNASPAGSGRVAKIDPSVDVVKWILDGEYQEGWLVGDMGSGKTITLTRAAWRAAVKWLEWDGQDGSREAALHSGPPVPMLLSCSSFYPREPEARAALTADDLVAAMSRALGTASEPFGTILSTRKSLILLDGLDDVEDPDALSRIRDAIIRLRETPSNFKVVVTTRVSSPPTITVTDVLKIQAPNAATRAELVNKHALAAPQFQFRVKQVLRDVKQVPRDVRNARASTGESVYSTPLELAMACYFAQDAERPLNARFGELVKWQLDRAGARSEHPETWRCALQAVALERMKHKSGIPRDLAREVVSRVAGNPLAFLASPSGLASLAGIAKVTLGGTRDILEIETSFRHFLAAEALASFPADRIRQEIPDGWTSVVKFVPGILARASRLNDAFALIADLATTAEQDPDSSEIWLSGLASLVDHSALQMSQEASRFALRARDALGGSTHWSLATRAAVLDACGLAASPYLHKIVPPDAVPVPEIKKPGRRCYIANAPVLVSDYAQFLDDPQKDHADYWFEIPPGFVHEADEGAWYEQLRTPLRPVTGVTWHEAKAYCRWLARQPGFEGCVVRLPTRQEWKAVARPEGSTREYPWEAGQQFNYRGSGLDHPSPVGLFPPYCRENLLDFGTNIYEWSGENVTGQRGDVEVLGGSWKALVTELRIDRNEIYCRTDWRRPDTGFRYLLERPND